MKYWVYKESRILGPFDKEGVSGLPGLDSGTLVCEGDPSGGSWLPAGEIKDLGGFKASATGVDFGELPSTIGLLDQLQIDASGLVGDDDFPGSLAEDLFQDASFRKGFGDVLSEETSSGNADAARARQKNAELTIQLETMYKRIAELENSQAELLRRLGEKERELLSQETGIPADAAPAKTFLSPAPAPKAAAPTSPPPAGLEPASAPSDWSESKGAGAPLPAIFDAPAPSVVVPAVPNLPAMPSFAPPAAPPPPPLGLPADAAAPAAPEIPAIVPKPAPKTASFGKPKTFKIVPTVKSFKVLGAADVAPADANPAPVFSEPASTPAPAAAVPPPPPPAPTPAPAPVIPPPPTIAPVQLAPAPVPAPIPAPAPVPEPVMPNPFAPPEPVIAAPVPTPVAPPPNTLSRSQPQPVPDLGATVQASADDLAGSVDANLPPMTLARGRGAAEAPVDAGVAARFAKPEPAPVTAEPKPARSNKKFLIGGGILVILLVIVGVIFMRQPKDDLKQMATLDDGKAPIGLGADDTASAPPMVKPRPAEPEPAPAPVPPPPPPGPSAEHQAAIDAVKDFPLDGGRGTVGRWLQYSYTASPGAGTEEWNASTTGENNVLVEYRMVPGAGGGNGALYLFEVNGMGLVMGKNLEARQMLAGGPPAEPAKPKKAKAPAKKVKRRPVVEEPKEVPLLPLPDSGELRPPAEDDGTFGSDTINSGI